MAIIGARGISARGSVGTADYEALRVPKLRSAALFREHALHQLRAFAWISASPANRDGSQAGSPQLARACEPPWPLSLLRQWSSRRLQLADPGRRFGPILRCVPP